jgi:PTH2 family peptidyl-tRNA hydrolase
MSIKQVIVMRKDLNMRKGKMIAQGAHASMKVFFDKMRTQKNDRTDMYNKGRDKVMHLSNEELEWAEGLFTKICVSVNSEAELLEAYNKAKEAGLNCALITDSGLTEFAGVQTNTCIAIGPNASEKIDLITGKFPLL